MFRKNVTIYLNVEKGKDVRVKGCILSHGKMVQNIQNETLASEKVTNFKDKSRHMGAHRKKERRFIKNVLFLCCMGEIK